MTDRVLIVNHGPQDVTVDTYRERTGVAGVFVPDPVVKTDVVRAHQELSVLVYEGQYVRVRK